MHGKAEAGEIARAEGDENGERCRGLHGRSMGRACDFYRNLGWPQIIDDGQFAAFELRGIVLALFPINQLARDGNAEPELGTDGIRFTIGMMVDAPDEVDRLTERMRSAGARVTKEPVDAEFFTRRSAYLSATRGATTSRSPGPTSWTTQSWRLHAAPPGPEPPAPGPRALMRSASAISSPSPVAHARSSPRRNSPTVRCITPAAGTPTGYRIGTVAATRATHGITSTGR
jgi:uncharacterized protein